MGQSFHPGGRGETQPHRVDFQEQQRGSNKTIRESLLPGTSVCSTLQVLGLLILKYITTCVHCLLFTLITVAGPIALNSALVVHNSKLTLCPHSGLSCLGQFPALWGSEELNRQVQGNLA